MAAAQLAIAYDGSPSAATAVRTAAALFAGARAKIVTVPAPLPHGVQGASRFLMSVPSGTLERRAHRDLRADHRGGAARSPPRESSTRPD